MEGMIGITPLIHTDAKPNKTTYSITDLMSLAIKGDILVSIRAGLVKYSFFDAFIDEFHARLKTQGLAISDGNSAAKTSEGAKWFSLRRLIWKTESLGNLKNSRQPIRWQRYYKKIFFRLSRLWTRGNDLRWDERRWGKSRSFLFLGSETKMEQGGTRRPNHQALLVNRTLMTEYCLEA